MDPYIILAKIEQGAWIETKEIGTSQWSKQEQLILAQGEDCKKGHLIYLMRKGSFQVILYKMIRFLSGKLKKHTKLAKIVKISEIFNRLVFPLNFNRFCHPMTVPQFMPTPTSLTQPASNLEHFLVFRFDHLKSIPSPVGYLVRIRG